MGKRRRKVAPARAPQTPPKGGGTGDGADSETTRCDPEADFALEAGRSRACDAQEIAACKDGEAAARQVDGEEGARAAGRVDDDDESPRVLYARCVRAVLSPLRAPVCATPASMPPSLPASPNDVGELSTSPQAKSSIESTLEQTEAQGPNTADNTSRSSVREATIHHQVIGDGASPHSSSGCSVGSKCKGGNYVHGGDLPETKDSLRKGQDDLKEQARQWNDARMLETLERGRAREDGSEGSADKEAMQQEMQNLIHTLEVRDARMADILENLKEQMSSASSPAIKSCRLRDIRCEEEDGLVPSDSDIVAKGKFCSSQVGEEGQNEGERGQDREESAARIVAPITPDRRARASAQEGQEDDGTVCGRDDSWTEIVVCTVTPWGLKRAVQREMDQERCARGWRTALVLEAMRRRRCEARAFSMWRLDASRCLLSRLRAMVAEHKTWAPEGDRAATGTVTIEDFVLERQELGGGEDARVMAVRVEEPGAGSTEALAVGQLAENYGMASGCASDVKEHGQDGWARQADAAVVEGKGGDADTRCAGVAAEESVHGNGSQETLISAGAEIAGCLPWPGAAMVSNQSVLEDDLVKMSGPGTTKGGRRGREERGGGGGADIVPVVAVLHEASRCEVGDMAGERRERLRKVVDDIRRANLDGSVFSTSKALRAGEMPQASYTSSRDGSTHGAPETSVLIQGKWKKPEELELETLRELAMAPISHSLALQTMSSPLSQAHFAMRPVAECSAHHVGVPQGGASQNYGAIFSENMDYDVARMGLKSVRSVDRGGPLHGTRFDETPESASLFMQL